MDAVINEFRVQLRQRLREVAGLSSPGINTAKVIYQRLEAAVPVLQWKAQPCPLDDLLQQLSESVDTLPDALHPLVHSILELTNYLEWYKKSVPNLPDFMDGHVNAEIIGPRGLEVRDDLIVGVTLMRPGLTYPDHHHPPEEVYIVLSEGLWRQDDNPWWSPGPGGYVYNPADIVHSMRSVERPLLALWCLKQ